MVLIVSMQVNIFIHKMHAAELLKQRALTTIIADASDIVWESKKEVTIHGQLFDIESFYINAEGKYVLTGLFDDQEMLLVKELNNLGKEKSKQQSYLMIKFFSLQSIAQHNIAEINTFNNTCLQTVYYPRKGILSKGFIAVFSPPPKILLSSI